MTSNKRGKEGDMTPEQLHNWYLEATRILHPESFNAKAQKPYSELTEEQQAIDKYIFNRFMQWHKEQRKAWALRKVPKKETDVRCACDGFNSCREQMIKNINKD